MIDATGLGPGTSNTGTGRILEQLVPAMQNVRPEAIVTVAGSCRSLLGSAELNVCWVDRIASTDTPQVLFRPRQLLANRELTEVIKPGRRVVLYQLDTIAVTHQYFPTEHHGQLARNVVRSALRSADVVATLSESSRNDILLFCPDIEPRRLAIVPCGATIHPGPQRRPAFASGRPYCLVLSAAFQHKNRPFALSAFSEMLRLGYQGDLVLAGPEPVYGSTIREEDLALKTFSGRVHRVGPVDNDEKWWLLEHADAVLYPSTHEGFGLIPFEAAAVNTPTAMAAVSCFQEVCGPHVRLLQGFDASEWGRELMAWVSDAISARQQVDALQQRARQLTWSKSAESAWDAIDLAASLPPRLPTDWEGSWLQQPMRTHIGLPSSARAANQAVRVLSAGRRRVSELLGRSTPSRGY